MEESERESAFEVILLGNAGVGKTSIIKRFVDRTFSKKRDKTTMHSIYSKIFEVETAKREISL